MQKSILVLLLIASLVVAGCSGPAMMPARSADTATGESFMLALPRIVLTTDETGAVGVEGLPLAALGLQSVLGNLNPEFVNRMQEANIQHLEMRHTGDGLAIMVNGMPMPRLAWGDDSIQTMGDLMYLLGPQMGVQGEAIQQLLTKLAPIIQRLGLSVAIKFPTAAGVEQLPFASDEVALAPPRAVEADPSMLAKFEVKYDDQGVPSIMGISARDIAQLTGNPSLPLALSPDVIRRAQEMNVQNMQVTTGPTGLAFYINGNPVPKLIWDQDMVGNAIDVVTQLDPNLSMYSSILKQLAPVLTNTSVSILMHFPVAEGVEALPVEMQQ